MELPRGVLGGPWGSLGGSQGAPKTEVVLGERPGMVLGGPWGCCWRYWAILGSVLRGQNVVISLVLDDFLRCHDF